MSSSILEHKPVANRAARFSDSAEPDSTEWDNRAAAAPAGETSAAADSGLSEAEYVQRETERTKAAIQETIENLKAKLKEAGDVRLWAERYPWATVAVAAVAGFTAATAIIPPKQASRPSVAPHVGNGYTQPPPPEQPSAARPVLAATLINSLFDLAKSAIENSFAKAREAGDSSDRPRENGAETSGPV